MDNRQCPASPLHVGAVRVSLACIQCRTRHVRCDAKKPQCGRCTSRGEQCQYAESRRGGLTRTAKAARRSLAATESRTASLERIFESAFPFPQREQPPQDGTHNLLPLDTNSMSQIPTSPSTPCGAKPWSAKAIPHFVPAESLNIPGDPCIDLYYKHFHRHHPCVLPQTHLERLLEDSSRQVSLKPLISVMRFVGSLYARLEQGKPLVEDTINVCVATEQCPRDPFTVQYRLIYSITLYWCGEHVRSREEMNRAIELALELGMHRRSFATQHGHGDSVREESWRRTWWQLYIVDSWYAAIKHVRICPTYCVDVTTELPCEEEEYESGAIPPPKTLEEFDSREFSAINQVYSSFAYLIGITHDLYTVMAGLEWDTSNDSASNVAEMIDVVIEGWLLLLPESKRQILSRNGEFDELMFQANMAIHALTLSNHRQFSALALNPVERISSCLSNAPDNCFCTSVDYETIHTARCLQAIEAQIRLISLPIRPYAHTPFVICMLATGTISLLSACKYFLTGQKLAVARHQIKMSLGYIKSLSKVWPQAQTTVQEIQTIAREVLEKSSQNHPCIPCLDTVPPNCSIQPSLSPGFDVSQDSSACGLAMPFLEILDTEFHLSDTQADTTWFVADDHES